MKKNGFAPLIIILVIALLGVVGYFGYKNYLVKPQVLTIPSPSPLSVPDQTKVLSQIPGWKIYTNTKYHFSIEYPEDWTFREFPDTHTGASFRLASDSNDLNHEHISVDFNSRSTDLIGVPFEEYVKKGAIEDIQNFVSLATITKIVTLSGLVGYKTTWNVQEMNQPTGKTSMSMPITYFDTKDSNGDTVWITESDSSYSNIYDQMLSTFKFIK